MKEKKISIVTVCFNSDKTIEDTSKSILIQTFQDYECVVIDGSSSDKTLEKTKNYIEIFQDELLYISKSTKGVYDVMKKGIILATGGILDFKILITSILIRTYHLLFHQYFLKVIHYKNIEKIY
jgi:glycosyltransferase involved in cell wall biosynthesis